jgi:hypothetical protein
VTQEHPSLRLLREVRRVERLAHRFSEPIDPDEVWAALHTFPPESDDAPGWLDRLVVPRAHRPLQRAYGEVVRFRRADFFSTVPVPFTGIALRGGGEIVAFRAMVRKDLALSVLRFAAERLWASQGWRFPGDLAQPTAFEAILELAFGGDPACRYRLRCGSLPDGEEGELVLEAVDRPPWRDDRVSLCWGPRRLGFRSDRYGWF